jgi:hypothetical protein
MLNEVITEALTTAYLIVIMGDLNADLLKPKLHLGKILINSVKLTGIKIPNTIPTRISKNCATCLDKIAIDEEVECLSYTVKHLAASNHLPVTASVRADVSNKLQAIHNRSFKNVNISSLRDDITNIKINVSMVDDPDLSLEHWHSEFMSIFDKGAPIRNFPTRKHRIP